MARNINDIYEFMRFIVKKERGIFLKVSDAMASLDAGQLNLLEDYFKEYGQTQIIHDAIRPFRVYYPFTTDAAGFITYPNDYLHLVGSPFTVNGSTVNEISIVNEDEWVTALLSKLRPVTVKRPLGKDTSSGLSIYPQVQQNGFLTYIRRPNTPVLAFTQVGRTLTYDSANSTQLEWSDTYINAVIAKALLPISENMNEATINQFSQQFNQQSE